jgi:hypothetical protein
MSERIRCVLMGWVFAKRRWVAAYELEKDIVKGKKHRVVFVC